MRSLVAFSFAVLWFTFIACEKPTPPLKAADIPPSPVSFTTDKGTVVVRTTTAREDSLVLIGRLGKLEGVQFYNPNVDVCNELEKAMAMRRVLCAANPKLKIFSYCNIRGSHISNQYGLHTCFCVTSGAPASLAV